MELFIFFTPLVITYFLLAAGLWTTAAFVIWLLSFKGQLFSADRFQRWIPSVTFVHFTCVMLSQRATLVSNCLRPPRALCFVRSLGFFSWNDHFSVFSWISERWVMCLPAAFWTSDCLWVLGHLLLLLWILYIWITGLDPQLHFTHQAEFLAREIIETSVKIYISLIRPFACITTQASNSNSKVTQMQTRGWGVSHMRSLTLFWHRSDGLRLPEGPNLFFRIRSESLCATEIRASDWNSCHFRCPCMHRALMSYVISGSSGERRGVAGLDYQ